MAEAASDIKKSCAGLEAEEETGIETVAGREGQIDEFEGADARERERVPGAIALQELAPASRSICLAGRYEGSSLRMAGVLAW